MKSILGLLSVILIVALTAISARAVNYSFTKVADETTAAPTGNFDAFDSYVSINDGTAAFIGDWSALANRGVFTGNGGPLTKIAQTGDLTPIGSISEFRSLSFRDATTVLFTGFHAVPNASGIFTGSGGTLTTIAKTGDLAPVGTMTLVVAPSTSGGTTAYIGDYNSFQGSGIFTTDGQQTTTIVKTGDPAPIGTFDSILGLAFDSGTAAFLGTYNGISPRGIFKADSGGAITTLAKIGDVAPIGAFTDFGSLPSISGGTTAFLGKYNGGADTGIFTSSGGPLTTIIKTGDAAPIGTFDSFTDPVIRGNTIAFVASYNGFNDQAIFTISGGMLTRVIGLGDPLFGGAVSELPPDASSGLSIDNGGNLAFVYYSSGRQGVAIARPVPEPSGLVLALSMAPVVLLGGRWLHHTQVAISERSPRRLSVTIRAMDP